jgi:hypothetical protein
VFLVFFGLVLLRSAMANRLLQYRSGAESTPSGIRS